MALVDITTVEVKESGPSYDKFDVEKNDKARIHIPSGKVVQENVHVFHREEPTMIERNGRKVPEWSRESFAGTYICLGDFETVMSSPSYGDPANCPACKAMNSGTRLIERPKRTFALNVVRYATQKRSTDLRNKNVENQVWRHADVRKIEPILNAAREKPLNEIDFLIEADNSDWKKYQIQPSLGEPAFTKDTELKANMKNAYDNQFSVEVLVDACGKKLTVDALTAEVSRLEAEHRLESAQEATTEVFTTSDDTTSSNGFVDIEEKTTADDLVVMKLDDVNNLNESLFEGM
jgi:hypothetical protein